MAGGLEAANMPGLTQADGDQMVAISKQMSGPLQTLEKDLKALGGAQGVLETAFRGNAGNAVYNAFGNVLTTGSNLARFMEQIMDQIISGSSAFDSEDQAAMQAVKGQLGEAGDGNYANPGAQESTWNNGDTALESTAGPSKAKVDWA
ncbi:hypothetical protein [Nocardia sp. NPDC019395]|uniref:hypothetical protein n=1 Tax=Nocardia sp. NPDC019395 TaxID=3154686 RepID=UPI00340CAF94